MTSIATEAAAQLRRELGAAAARWTPIIGPDDGLTLEQRAVAVADRLAVQLASDDDREAAQTVIDLLHVLWGDTDPPHDWWRTPVGRLCARSLGHHDAEAVTHSVAAAMLGIARGTVSTLVSRGSLERHPDGGVTRGSVMARLAGQIRRG